MLAASAPTEAPRLQGLIHQLLEELLELSQVDTAMRLRVIRLSQAFRGSKSSREPLETM